MIYLDNAATTFPKPLSVSEEVKYFMDFCGGNAGRGSHRLSMKAAEKIYECREKLSDFFDAASPENVVFTLNTTYALNYVIKGILKEGDHVIISGLEHNSVFRPIYKLASEGKISYDIFDVVRNGKRLSDAEILKGIREVVKINTKMLICVSMSNICSVALPIVKIGSFCRSQGIFFVVDGAQGGGHEILSMRDMNIDALCLPAHKGLYGPQGCGLAILGDGITANTLIEGGNGLSSLDGDMGLDSPERYEAGTLPAPVIAGLLCGVKEVEKIGIEEISSKEKLLFRRARDLLSEIRGVSIYLPEEEGAIISFGVRGRDSEDVCRELDAQGICVRGGYHCSALGHRSLGSYNGGSVRASFGMYNTYYEIEKFARAVKEICKEEGAKRCQKS